MDLPHADLDRLVRRQGGVVSRRQVLAARLDDNLIERRLRRREWASLHPGVYLDHTGTPTEEQRRHGAVLYAWPAALGGESALLAHGMRHLTEPAVTVVIDRHRRVRSQPGMTVHRIDQLDERALWNLDPPRLRVEAAAVQLASRRWATTGEGAAVALLADICQQRLSTPGRLLASVDAHPCLTGRRFLRTVLSDVANGTYSVLEHRYLTRVERAHGLPIGDRQVGFRATRPGFRDVWYRDQGVLIELDGRLGHEWAVDQWADLERDLLAATDQLQTVRLGWGAVASSCRLAPVVGRLLQARGWTGGTHTCRACRD